MTNILGPISCLFKTLEAPITSLHELDTEVLLHICGNYAS